MVRIALGIAPVWRAAHAREWPFPQYRAPMVDPLSDAALELLQRLAWTYLGPDVVFPAMPDPPPGFVTRIRIERVAGIGAWRNQGGG